MNKATSYLSILECLLFRLEFPEQLCFLTLRVLENTTTRYIELLLRYAATFYTLTTVQPQKYCLVLYHEYSVHDHILKKCIEIVLFYDVLYGSVSYNMFGEKRQLTVCF